MRTVPLNKSVWMSLGLVGRKVAGDPWIYRWRAAWWTGVCVCVCVCVVLYVCLCRVYADVLRGFMLLLSDIMCKRTERNLKRITVCWLNWKWPLLSQTDDLNNWSYGGCTSILWLYADAYCRCEHSLRGTRPWKEWLTAESTESCLSNLGSSGYISNRMLFYACRSLVGHIILYMIITV